MAGTVPIRMRLPCIRSPYPRDTTPDLLQLVAHHVQPARGPRHPQAGLVHAGHRPAKRARFCQPLRLSEPRVPEQLRFCIVCGTVSCFYYCKIITLKNSMEESMNYNKIDWSRYSDKFWHDLLTALIPKYRKRLASLTAYRIRQDAH